MNRIFSAFFAVGLVALWLLGLFGSHSSLWLSWVHGALAVWSACIAAELLPDGPLHPTLITVVLMASSIAAALEKIPAWQQWFTIVFGFGFLGLSIASDFQRRKMAESAGMASQETDRAA